MIYKEQHPIGFFYEKPLTQKAQRILPHSGGFLRHFLGLSLCLLQSLLVWQARSPRVLFPLLRLIPLYCAFHICLFLLFSSQTQRLDKNTFTNAFSLNHLERNKDFLLVCICRSKVRVLRHYVLSIISRPSGEIGHPKGLIISNQATRNLQPRR